jgi:uncharacterized membrane protein YqjE
MTDDAQGPATNLLRSLVRLGGTLLAVAHTRIELLTTEISEDLERGLQMLLWALVALMAVILAALLAGLTVVIYFWDTHRLGACIAVTLAFLCAGVLAGLRFRKRLREKPRLLDASRSELRRDVRMLGGDR